MINKQVIKVKKAISYKRTKIVRIPTEVTFKTKDGETISFKGTKIIRKEV